MSCSHLSISLGVVLSMAAAAVVGAQRDVPIPKSPAGGYPVTLTGCIHGTRFTPQSATSTTASDAVRASEYVLDGSREMMQTIKKEHNNHRDEITGTIELPASPAAQRSGIASQPIGKKGRVTVATRDGSGGLQASPHPVRLKVASITHTGNRCSARSE